MVVEPSNSTDAPTFESSAPQYASVSSDGTVKAEAEGSANVVVKAGAQSTACAVTVKSQTPAPTEKVTITINPTPSDATVKLNGEVKSSIEVDKGSSVTYEVSKEGYTSKSDTVLADSTKTVDVVLEILPE